MEAIEKAILKDKKALKELGGAVIDAGGFRLPETALIGGLLEIVSNENLSEIVAAGRSGDAAAQALESVADYVKKALRKDNKIARGYGALVVHAGGYRLDREALASGLRFIVRSYDADPKKREEWQAAGARFLGQKNKPPRLRKSAPSAPSAKGESQREAANDSSGQPKAAGAEKVAGVEA